MDNLPNYRTATKLLLPFSLLLMTLLGCSEANSANQESTPARMQNAPIPQTTKQDSPATVRLEGSAFIVTQEGESLKLGLLELKFIKRADLEAFAETNGTTIKNDFLNAWVEEFRAMRKWSTDPHTPSLLKGIKTTNALDSEMLNSTGPILDKQLFDKLPPAFATTKTDADGKFWISLPRNERFVLAARTYRRAGGWANHEFCHWLVNVNLNADSAEPFFLSNHNILIRQSPDSFTNLLTFSREDLLKRSSSKLAE
jgi:hypothetical protein